MSRVYFTSPSGEAELRGSERAYAGSVTNDLALSQLRLDRGFSPDPRSRYGRLLPSGHYLEVVKDEFFANSFRTWWQVGDLGDRDGFLPIPEARTTPWEITLNTAIFCGNDAIELLARIHATCEIHGWFEGEHRAWMADIMQGGREANILRPNQGWEEVIEFLRSRDDEPVVMSYSVCDGFPNEYLAREAGVWTRPEPVKPEGWSDEDWNELDEDSKHDYAESWYKLSEDEQWDLCMKALREHWTGRVDIHPDMWSKRGFGGGDRPWTVFDLEAWLDQEEAAVTTA